MGQKTEAKSRKSETINQISKERSIWRSKVKGVYMKRCMSEIKEERVPGIQKFKSHKSEVKGLKLETKGKKAETRNQKSKVISQRPDIKDRRSEVKGEKFLGWKFWSRIKSVKHISGVWIQYGGHRPNVTGSKWGVRGQRSARKKKTLVFSLN